MPPCGQPRQPFACLRFPLQAVVVVVVGVDVVVVGVDIVVLGVALMLLACYDIAVLYFDQLSSHVLN